MGLRGHRPGCRCVGCSPATRARGLRALRAAPRRTGRNQPRALALYARTMRDAADAARAFGSLGVQDPRAAHSAEGWVVTVPESQAPIADGLRSRVLGLVPGLRGENPATPAARKYVSREIALLERGKGYSHPQAVAVALKMARKAGYRSVPLPESRNPRSAAAEEVLTALANISENTGETVNEIRNLTELLAGGNPRRSRSEKFGPVYPVKAEARRLVESLHAVGPGRFQIQRRAKGYQVVKVPRRRNPLDRRETAQVLGDARFETQLARRSPKGGVARAYRVGAADTGIAIARRYGERPPGARGKSFYHAAPVKIGWPEGFRNPRRIAGSTYSAAVGLGYPYIAGEPVIRGSIVFNRFQQRVDRPFPAVFVGVVSGRFLPIFARNAEDEAVIRAHVPRGNPLTRRETAQVLRHAQRIRRAARTVRRGASRYLGPARASEMALAERYQARASEAAFIAHTWGKAKRAYMPNPPRVVGTIPGGMTRIFYNRVGKYRGPYVHKFSRGVRAFRMSDGSVLLRGKKPLWVRQD